MASNRPENTSKPIEIVIFGTGAMATLFGGRLSRRAPDLEGNTRPFQMNVTLFGSWQEQIEALSTHGLIIQNLDGYREHIQIKATSTVTQLPAADIALVLVKSYQTEGTAQIVSQNLRRNGLVVTLQNGIGNLEILQRMLGAHRVMAGSTMLAANIPKVGFVQCTGAGQTYLGRAESSLDQVETLVTIFKNCKIPVSSRDDVTGILWAKLVINAGINALGALLEVRNGELVKDARYRRMVQWSAQEAVAVASAKKIHLPFEDPIAKTLEVCETTALNRSSMLQDLTRGASVEIDAINGAIVRLGKRLGVETPVNEFLVREVRRKANGGTFDKSRLVDFSER
jgi:2-dehydropantoate 2-reductase